jgi:hypothetical protein
MRRAFSRRRRETIAIPNEPVPPDTKNDNSAKSIISPHAVEKVPAVKEMDKTGNCWLSEAGIDRSGSSEVLPALFSACREFIFRPAVRELGIDAGAKPSGGCLCKPLSVSELIIDAGGVPIVYPLLIVRIFVG